MYTARELRIRCRCPWLTPFPSIPIFVLYPKGNESIKSRIFATVTACSNRSLSITSAPIAIFFAIESESLGGYAESDDFEVGKLRNNATTGYVSKFIYTIPSEILADSENSNEICYEVAHKQSNSS